MDARSQMEARRKKILENAEARMNKILGRSTTLPKETTDHPASTSGNNGYINGSIPTSFEIRNVAAIPETSSYSYRSPQQTEPLPPVVNRAHTTLVVDIVFFFCLGVFTRMSYHYGWSWSFNENLLLPFLLAGIPWAYFNSSRGSHTSEMFISTLLLYRGTHQKIVHNICRTISFVRTLAQFFSLYLFSFITLHCALEYTTDVQS